MKSKQLKSGMLIVAALVLMPVMMLGQAVVTGTVQTASGSAVSGAFVSLAMVLTPEIAQSGKLPPSLYYSMTQADAEGRYRFENIPLGQFRLCAQSPGSKLLNPCEWSGEEKSTAIPIVTVSEANVKGKTEVKATALTMSEGYLFQVRIEDGNGLLKANKHRVAGASVHFWVSGKTGSTPLFPTPKMDPDFDLSVVLPYDTDLNLSAVTSYFSISDKEGKATMTDSGFVKVLRFSRASSEAAQAVTITGVKGQ